MYKTVVVKDNVRSSDEEGIKDLQYWKSGNESSGGYDYIEIKFEAINNTEKLTNHEINNIGLVSENIQGAYKADKYPELFLYIEKVFTLVDKK